jgi:capsular polysaccharide biosynthesis protein
LAGDYVLFAGPGYRIYGHWLVDLLPKLYLLAASGLDVARCKFLMPADLPRFGRALLNAVGIDDSQLVHYDPSHDELLVEQLLVPTITHNSVRFSELYEKAVRFLVDRIRHGIGPLNPVERPTRLFVSRGTSKQRLCVNREQIESMAGAAGFTILRPELLPFAEQVQQFAAARCILGEYGSGLHGSIFSRPGTVVCGLKEASHNRLSFLQSGIGEALGQPTGYVYGEPITGGAAGSFSISPDAFSACLRLVFGSTPLMSPSYSGTAGRP